LPALRAPGGIYEQIPQLSKIESDGLVANSLDEAGNMVHNMDYAPPSAALIALIQSGNLRYPAWAVPRRVGDAPGISRMVVADGLLVADQTEVTVAPELQSSAALVHAFLGTILPALVTRPRALVQWATLVRSALTLEQSLAGKWAAAELWVKTQLSESTTRGTALTATNLRTHEEMALRGMLAASAAGTAGAAPPARPTGSSRGAAQRGSASSVATRRADGGDPRGRARSPDRRSEAGSRAAPRICHDWNSRKGCSHPNCRFLHVCNVCRSSAHGEPSCSNRRPPTGAHSEAAPNSSTA
jgi:hypothetical protein